MQLSYNVIKNDNVRSQGEKNIKIDRVIAEEMKVRKLEKDEVSNIDMTNYENMAKVMMENARRKSEEMIFNAGVEANNLKEEAYKQGYESGKNNGYNEIISVAKKEAEELINSSNRLLQSAKEEYIDYLKEKTEEIKKLSITIAKDILKREVLDATGIDAMIMSAIIEARNAKSIIIKCNKVHYIEYKERTGELKERLAYKGDLFILEDSSIDVGNLVLEKNNGKMIVGIEAGIAKIKELLEGD